MLSASHAIAATSAPRARVAIAIPAAARFWAAQLVIWSIYGLALMLPWLGSYPVAAMIPAKVVIAGTATLICGALASVYRSARMKVGHVALGACVLFTSFGGGLVWDVSLKLLLGGSAGHELVQLGDLNAGVPQLAGALYHGVILLAWSLGYLGWSRPPERRAVAAAALAESEQAQDEATAPLLLRDGRRFVSIDPREIDWIQASGDYVRIHLRSRQLLIRGTLASVEALLPAAMFVRIHRSTVVRVADVREIVARPNREYEVVLRDGVRLRVSRTYSDRFREAVASVHRSRIGAAAVE